MIYTFVRNKLRTNTCRIQNISAVALLAVKVHDKKKFEYYTSCIDVFGTYFIE